MYTRSAGAGTRLKHIKSDRHRIGDLEMMQNLALSEVEFGKFQRFCQEKGFDLSYFSSEVSGSREQIERHQFDSPKVIKLRKRRFGFDGIPYDVAEWQNESWHRSLPKLKDEFFTK